MDRRIEMICFEGREAGRDCVLESSLRPLSTLPALSHSPLFSLPSHSVYLSVHLSNYDCVHRDGQTSHTATIIYRSTISSPARSPLFGPQDRYATPSLPLPASFVAPPLAHFHSLSSFPFSISLIHQHAISAHTHTTTTAFGATKASRKPLARTHTH